MVSQKPPTWPKSSISRWISQRKSRAQAGQGADHDGRQQGQEDVDNPAVSLHALPSSLSVPWSSPGRRLDPLRRWPGWCPRPVAVLLPWPGGPLKGLRARTFRLVAVGLRPVVGDTRRREPGGYFSYSFFIDFSSIPLLPGERYHLQHHKGWVAHPQEKYHRDDHSGRKTLQREGSMQWNSQKSMELKSKIAQNPELMEKLTRCVEQVFEEFKVELRRQLRVSSRGFFPEERGCARTRQPFPGMHAQRTAHQPGRGGARRRCHRYRDLGQVQGLPQCRPMDPISLKILEAARPQVSKADDDPVPIRKARSSCPCNDKKLMAALSRGCSR